MQADQEEDDAATSLDNAMSTPPAPARPTPAAAPDSLSQQEESRTAGSGESKTGVYGVSQTAHDSFIGRLCIQRTGGTHGYVRTPTCKTLQQAAFMRNIAAAFHFPGNESKLTTVPGGFHFTPEQEATMRNTMMQKLEQDDDLRPAPAATAAASSTAQAGANVSRKPRRVTTTAAKASSTASFAAPTERHGKKRAHVEPPSVQRLCGVQRLSANAWRGRLLYNDSKQAIDTPKCSTAEEAAFMRNFAASILFPGDQAKLTVVPGGMAAFSPEQQDAMRKSMAAKFALLGLDVLADVSDHQSNSRGHDNTRDEVVSAEEAAAAAAAAAATPGPGSHNIDNSNKNQCNLTRRLHGNKTQDNGGSTYTDRENSTTGGTRKQVDNPACKEVQEAAFMQKLAAAALRGVLPGDKSKQTVTSGRLQLSPEQEAAMRRAMTERIYAMDPDALISTANEGTNTVQSSDGSDCSEGGHPGASAPVASPRKRQRRAAVDFDVGAAAEQPATSRTGRDQDLEFASQQDDGKLHMADSAALTDLRILDLQRRARQAQACGESAVQLLSAAESESDTFMASVMGLVQQQLTKQTLLEPAQQQQDAAQQQQQPASREQLKAQLLALQRRALELQLRGESALQLLSPDQCITAPEGFMQRLVARVEEQLRGL
eukprot:TRINITY_DN4266_c0_g1_i1.p1 TRINITY_DN4266_c0_g1~~TRINITY_DN4266_c0_g1_i1.p1  ORF type:complete len:657 (+),score=157.87 TRINITY_DN4266_c0_g1_i1:185-2155(+)